MQVLILVGRVFVCLFVCLFARSTERSYICRYQTVRPHRSALILASCQIVTKFTAPKRNKNRDVWADVLIPQR